MAKRRIIKKPVKLLLDIVMRNNYVNGLAVVVTDATAKLTPVQCWIIGVGAIFARRNDMPTNRLGDYSPIHGILIRDTIKETLQKYWEVSTKNDLLKAIEWLRVEGHRTSCYQKEMERMDFIYQHSHPINENRYLIWDYCRMNVLYRWGYILGWFNKDWCWDQMLYHAREIQHQYTSWEEMAEAYLRGRELWAYGRLDDMHLFEEATEWLKKDKKSPWRIVDWNVSLNKDW